VLLDVEFIEGVELVLSNLHVFGVYEVPAATENVCLHVESTP